MPVLSLGVLYVFAVLPIAVVYGLPLALLVSVASMLAFNWFLLPPVHTFTLADSENWFALAVYLATAVVVSELAARARRRAAAAEQRERESALLAELATELLRGRDSTTSSTASRPVPRRSSASPAEIELGSVPPAPQTGVAAPAGGGRPIGRHDCTRRREPTRTWLRDRFLPALASLLAVAVERERLERGGARGRGAAAQRRS